MNRTLLAVRDRIRRAGWDVMRYPGAAPGRRRQLLLAGNSVDLVIDVGANIGQYGKELRWFGYKGRILSFEPMSDAFKQLQLVISHDEDWTAIRSALGAEAGEATINIAGNSISSSILPMLERHADVAPLSKYVGSEVVPVERLDVAAREAVNAAQRPFLKIDTQGFERAVLAGGEGLMTRFVGVELEMSLTPLYGGQMLMMETIEVMSRQGLRLAGLHDALFDERTGDTLQADGIFIRDQ